MRFLTLLATALACGYAGYAAAADMPIKAYAPPVLPLTWAGYYIGIDGGVTLNSPFKFSAVGTDVTKVDPRGGTFGGHAGHNWQTGPLVYSLEIDAFWNGNSKTVPLGELTTLNTKVDYFGSATAKLGLALFNDAVLLYGRGGIGFAHTAATVTETIPGITLLAPVTTLTSSAFEVHYGPVVGLGAEWRMFGSSSWLLRVDYQHYMLSKTSYAFGGAAQVNVPASLNMDVLTAGLSYKF
jgi:outer membrane immunogenic protein